MKIGIYEPFLNTSSKHHHNLPYPLSISATATIKIIYFCKCAYLINNSKSTIFVLHQSVIQHISVHRKKGSQKTPRSEKQNRKAPTKHFTIPSFHHSIISLFHFSIFPVSGLRSPATPFSALQRMSLRPSFDICLTIVRHSSDSPSTAVRLPSTSYQLTGHLKHIDNHLVELAIEKVLPLSSS